MNALVRYASRSWGVVAALLGLGAICTSNACSILVNADSHQCDSTSDCTQFPGSVCNDRHVCVLGETACRNNATCIDRYGAETVYCQRAPGEIAGTCTQLLSPQCGQLLADPGDLRNDEAVVLSVYFMPSWFALLKGGVDATELARRDFKANAGGLPALKGGKPRPPVFVACDVPFGEQGLNRDVTEHLLKIGVQGSLGPIVGDWMSYWLGRSTQLAAQPPNLAPMFMTMGNRFPGFENVPGTAGLFFTVGVPSEGRGKGYAEIIPVWEKSLRDAGKTGDIKVGYIGPGTATYFQVTNAFRQLAKWNDNKSAGDNETASNFREFGWGDTSLITDPGYVKAINELIQFKPDIVVCDGGTPCADVPKALQASGSANTTRYILGQEGQQSSLIDAIGTNEDFRKRVVGTHPGRSDKFPGFQLFLRRFLQTFNEPAEAQGFAGAAYDLAYELLFAVAAVGDAPITGPNIGKAIQTRFKKGGFQINTYDAGAKIAKAFQALQAGQNIDIDGSQHSAYFDETGQVEYEGQVWCVSKDTTLTNRFVDTGLSFSKTGTALAGTNSCF